METGEVSPENVDVFCEKGIFEVEDTKKILQVISYRLVSNRSHFALACYKIRSTD